MQVFYVNIGGGEPTVRPDFWELLDYADRPPRRGEVLHQRRPDHPERAAQLAATDYVDVQISLDGATAEVNDAVRGAGLLRRPRCARWRTSPAAGFSDSKISVVVTRHNVDQLDEFKAIADTLRRPAAASPGCARPGRGADVWDELHPTAAAAARSSTTGWSPTATRC